VPPKTPRRGGSARAPQAAGARRGGLGGARLGGARRLQRGLNVQLQRLGDPRTVRQRARERAAGEGGRAYDADCSQLFAWSERGRGAAGPAHGAARGVGGGGAGGREVCWGWLADEVEVHGGADDAW